MARSRVAVQGQCRVMPSLLPYSCASVLQVFLSWLGPAFPLFLVMMPKRYASRILARFSGSSSIASWPHAIVSVRHPIGQGSKHPENVSPNLLPATRDETVRLDRLALACKLRAHVLPRFFEHDSNTNSHATRRAPRRMYSQILL